MANEVAILAEPVNAITLPPWFAGLAVGTVQYPGMPAKKYLAGGSTLTARQRQEITAKREQIVLALDAGRFASQRTAVIAKVLLSYPSAQAGELSAAARGEAYRDALDDMPAWAIAEAIKRWNRGQAGEHNYSFAPAPAVLRKIVDGILAPYRVALDKVDTVINATTIDEAMKPTPAAAPLSIEPKLPRL